MPFFCWVFRGHPPIGTPQRALFTVIQAATTLVRVAPVASMLWEGG